jgi:hypothetical protein
MPCIARKSESLSKEIEAGKMPALPGSNQTSKSELLLNQTGESVLSMERESCIRMERESCIREARICSKYGARILYFVKRESVLSMERGHLARP